MITKTFCKQSRLLLIAAMAICAIFTVSTRAYAYGNDYLEKKDHYTAMTTGIDRIHFKLPVYSRGTYDYLVKSTESYVTYQVDGYTSSWPIFYFGSEHKSDGPSANDKVGYGHAWAKGVANEGICQITNTTSGQYARLSVDGQEYCYDVRKQKEADNDNDYVTWLEIDWYPPAYLDGKRFKVSVHVSLWRRVGSSAAYTFDWDLATGLVGQSTQQQPELFDPYFYGVADQGIAGYGYAAVPYVTYTEPISYTTSLSNEEIKTSDRSGHIFVPTTDTVQEGFSATFTTWRNKSLNDQASPIQSTKVNIRPYHRPYNLTVEEEKDSLDTYTGNNVLRWEVKNPDLVDLVENDYFEIQRALESDFSDAKTLDVKAMQRGQDKGTYTYVDNSREIWTGNAAAAQGNKKRSYLFAYARDYILRDANGNPLYEMDIQASSKTTPMPAVPVYYRIRRASSAVWGWYGHEFALDTVCEKHNYLAPLATTQPNYKKDSNYVTNRKVHFTIDIENREITDIPSDFDVNYIYKRCLLDSVPIVIYREGPATGHDGRVNIYSPGGVRDLTWNIGDDTLRTNVATGSEICFQEEAEWYGEAELTSGCGYRYTVTGPAEYAVAVERKESSLWFMGFNRVQYLHHIQRREKPEVLVSEALERERTHLQDTMQALMQKEIQKSTYGRAMWDRTAQLVLIRTMDGLQNEILIPQDSITRLLNGNWQAHYTDIANNACTNYSYAVRIDQDNADLCVYDSSMLLPVAITGESLYFDEGADIAEFEASVDNAKDDYKRGVTLSWIPTSQAVDRYVLERKVENSDAVADTVYQGQENSYFDTKAVPGVTYRYTLTVLYDCNGRHTAHSASTIGRRSIYGEIRGNVLMPDNAGMAGVSVALQGEDGQVVRTTVTDAVGEYRFDSLTYNIASGSSYVIVPTHAYGVFRFNNTSASTAAVTLSADNAIAYGIEFMNASTARLSGRALYKGSTIPVAGAMFLLNGDTVRRNGKPLTTAIDGTFELTVTKSQPNTLQIFKPGHTFEGEGILRVEDGQETFSLDKALDGVRFYDETKVRLIGRVAGGVDQRDLQRGFGIGTNNLGDDLQLVLQLEGDNTAHFVHDPNDLTRDTVQQTVSYRKIIPDGGDNVTHTLFEKKRITIQPDPKTGEYAVDLYPVKYKVVQATAKGYATLFSSSAGSETFDLTNAPLSEQTDTYRNNTITYNAVYDRIYRTPVQIAFTQLLYGIEQPGYGEPMMKASDFSLKAVDTVYLYTKQPDGTVQYTLGHPLFYNKRQYQFEATAYEDYYYNNDPQAGRRDRVPQRGGQVTVHNGLHSSTDHTVYELDNEGRNRSIWLMADNLETEIGGEGALRTVSAALTVEGNTVESDVFQAFLTGEQVNENELHATDAAIALFDIIRDPGGNGSSAWIESGSKYSYSYTENYSWEAGIELKPTWSVYASQDIGVLVGGPTGGTYTGSTVTVNKSFSIPIPISHSWSWGYKYNYTISTNEKISTSSKASRDGIGSNADVFFGSTISQICGKAKSVDIINDSLFQARQPAIQSGAMKVLASGTDRLGQPYHLVVGEKVVLGSQLGHTFAYTQHYIINRVIPSLILESAGMLMEFPDSAAAQAAADASGEPVYWFHDPHQINVRDTINSTYYKMIVPSNSSKIFTDKVAALNAMARRWIELIICNEKEKVSARMSGRMVGTYSVSYGSTLSHSDSYSSMANYNELPQSWAGFGNELESAASNLTQNLSRSNISNLLSSSGTNSIVKQETLNSVLNSIRGATAGLGGNNAGGAGNNAAGGGGNAAGGGEGGNNNGGQNNGENNNGQNNNGNQNADQGITAISATSKWSFDLKPILSFDADMRTSDDGTMSKSCGFTLSPDAQGDITVSVYRANVDSVWKDATSTVRQNLHVVNTDENQLFSRYVFFTEAGSTYCVHEEEEKTQYYNPGMLLNNPTEAIAVPQLSVDVHEQTGVPSDQRAVFRVELRNAGQVQTGAAAGGTFLSIALDPATNPDGAKVYLSGAPLINPVSYWLKPGEAIQQIVEVERGLVDDYDSLRLFFYVDDCLKYNNTSLDLGVHFLPVSCDVNIASPKQNWVMNTLSAKDSTGYYLPIDISGFNIRHKNFDHIEFQYKLSTESEDMWVNQCSFYANDSLYDLATGNKAKIVNGRITPFRFYGERDPMEQRYDLRAVSFCRYGSGFVTKSSPVISGVKDTRPPRVFGVAQPADAILGVGDNLMLRFNEPIAGNYLDEDNNFQIVGTTNATGITTGTSLHFEESEGSRAETKVERSLTNKSFTIDMVVRPADAMMPGSLFFTTMPSSNYSVQFGYAEGRLVLFMINEVSVYMFMTEANVLPSGIFSRVLAVYDNETKQVKFYIGTQEMPLSETGMSSLPSDFVLRGSAPLEFGGETETDMLEARIWSKALTQEEIAATNMKYLTGYERDLMAYYRMDEGRGNELTDRANGATLYCKATSWNHRKGISVALKADEELKLDGNLLGRSKVYDESIMLWFKTAGQNGSIFRAGRTDDKHGTLLGLENGRLMLHSDSAQWTIGDGLANNEWHHVVLTVNRTMNNAAVYVDGKVLQSFSADLLGGITGAMYLGGNGFVGNIDDISFFEQALPKYMVEGYDNLSPAGDEMGLLGYLPFEEQVLNPNGVLELVFSPNDQRVYRDQNGNVVEKTVPLILANGDQQPIANFADKVSYAPTRDQGLVTKMKFDWSFNGDELLINLNMADREINKQPIYVTVRDVEDLNGNPMASPVSWVAFVDRNALKWEQRTLRVESNYDNTEDFEYFIDIINHSGRRHQYTIESLPDWLSVNEPYGTMNAQEEKQIRLRFDANLPVGVYSDQIYLTDEEGLAEPLVIEYAITAGAPYDEVDRTKYPLNMSICGQVKIAKTNETVFDSDERDIVYAMYKNECVGMANISFDDMSGKSKLHLTVYGSDEMDGNQIRFQLWQASTGKVFDLSADRTITFKHGNVYGCGDGNPVQLTTNGSERQTIQLQPGWNWTSFNLDLRQYVAKMANIMTANEPWTENDLIKNPATRHFVIWSDSLGRFTGDFDYLRYIYTYMIYCQNGNTMHISGNNLPTDSMYVPVYGGRWCAMPCLLKQVTPVTEALSDYYDLAQPGDMLKSHDHFAYFSEDRKWEGDLSVMRPGEGYLFRRLAQDTVKIRFYNRSTPNSLRNRITQNTQTTPSGFSNPQAATNMTMIATIEGLPITGDGLRVYVGDELAAIAEPKDSLYYLTIQSDRVGELRFEIDGQQLMANGQQPIRYQADSHYGTIKAPVVLRKDEGVGVYKIIENDKVVIIRNNERYDVTGKKL